MKKISIGTAVAGGLLCALALAGCQGDGGATVAVTSSASSDGKPGDGVPSATPTGTAGTDLAQATASPSDGG